MAEQASIGRPLKTLNQRVSHHRAAFPFEFPTEGCRKHSSPPKEWLWTDCEEDSLPGLMPSQVLWDASVSGALGKSFKEIYDFQF